jgi:hypothetical protein
MTLLTTQPGGNISKPITISIGEDVYVLGGLGNWVTYQQYVEMFNLKSINTIYNWVARGIVSDDHCVEIPDLNTKLIKAQAYDKKKAGRPKA